MNNITPEKLSWSTKLAYGAGDFGTAITANILVFYLLFFFTDVVGLSAGLAGSVLMVGKIADAINDPIVGMWSDRTQTVWGRRLPWMLAGAMPFGLFYILQWVVPRFSEQPNINNWGLFAYYVLIGILFNTAYTMVNLPYTALTPELTQDYDERTKLNSFRFSFSIGGSILSLILAGVVFSAYPHPEQGTEKFFILGLFCTALSVIGIFWCALRIQERGKKPVLNDSQKRVLGKSLLATTPVIILVSLFFQISGINAVFVFLLLLSVVIGLFGITLVKAVTEPHLSTPELVGNLEASDSRLSFKEQLGIVLTNRAFLYVIGIYLCSWLAVQLTASILIYFVVSWMGLSESLFSLVALAVQGTALLMLFFWQKVCQKYSKKVVYFMGMTLWIIAEIGLFFVQKGQVTQMYILAVIAGFGVSVAYLIPWSMMPDVIELDELKTGKRREGIFYAFMVLLQKIGLALGLFLVGIVLDLAGFIERVPGEPIPVQPASALLAIRLSISLLPAGFLILGLVLAYFYPITRELHAEICLKLRERKAQI